MRQAERAEHKMESKAVCDAMKAIADSTRAGTAEKAAKRSALNNLTEKGKELFVLVSAKTFNDTNPTMSADALTMIQDKNPSKITASLEEWTST